MTGLESNDRKAPTGSNRGLITVLVCAIICVLGFGGWLLTGRDFQPATTEPAADPVATLGSFYMPAEFEPQDMLFLGGDTLAARYPDVMTAMVEAVVREVRVIILAGSSRGRARIDSLLGAGGLEGVPVATLPLPEVSMWVRDFGPLTVTDAQGERSMVEFHNAARRGSRFDDEVPSYLAVQLDLAILGNALEVEGGDLLTNGRGFGVLSTRVVDTNIPSGAKDSREVIQTVASMLGLENVLLVPPLVGESTGHVDMFCTLVAPDLAVVGRLDPATDAENADRLDQIAADLAEMQTLVGPLRVERIPQPDHGDGVWRSYTNVVFANGVVLVPVYPNYCPDLDEEALAVYRQLLPDRRIVPIDASRLIRMNGGLRCLTMNVPVGGPLEPGPAY